MAGGFAAVWTVNHNKYGHRDAYFAEMALDGEINGENYAEYRRQFHLTKFGEVETPKGREHDFGVMEPEETGEHTFVIKNVGTGPMDLTLGATTCKCTLGELQDGTLEPGEQTEVKLSWTIKTNSKTFGQSAEIRTTAPDDPAIRFQINGLVVREFQVDPENVSFGEVPAGEDIDFNFNLYSYSDADVKLGDLAIASEPINELASFEVEEFTPDEENAGEYFEARQGFAVKGTIKSGLPQGALSTQIQIPLLQADVPEGEEAKADRYVSVKLGGRVVGALAMIPNAKLKDIEGGYLYNFGRLGKDDKHSASMMITLKGEQYADAKLRVDSVRPEGVIKAELVDRNLRNSTRLFKLNVELIPGEEAIERLGKSKGDYGVIQIESDDPRVSGMKIGIKFALEPR